MFKINLTLRFILNNSDRFPISVNQLVSLCIKVNYNYSFTYSFMCIHIFIYVYSHIHICVFTCSMFIYTFYSVAVYFRLNVIGST